jgi:probable HAF family extracellular repeat protein
MKLRVGPGALLLILGVVSPVWSPSRQPRRQRPSPPTGIDNNHQIAGVSDTASDYSHAVMWSNDTMTDLGTFGLDPVGETINNHGVIVGQSSLGAWIWSGGVFQTSTP